MERILAQLVSAIVTIILARLLLPEDYGVISLLTIFITLCNVLISDGLSSSLIQKKDADQLDYSTICWSSLLLAGILYAIIYICAPFLARYYDNELITNVFRVMALRIPLAAFNSVQGAYVSKNLLFKKFFFATLIGTITSGVVGIILAYKGFGAWALVAQYLTNSTMDTFFMFVVIDWKPSLCFSWQRFKELFSFGWKVLLSGLINESYEELRSLVIAKRYSTTDLSFYTKGKQFPQLIGGNITTTITGVMFPVYSTAQNDYSRLKSMVRRSIRTGCYILCPLMIGFAAISDTFVRLVLTDKWLPSVPFMQLFCFMFIFKPLKNINKCALKAIKRSDADLKISTVEKIVGVALVILFLNKGTMALAVTALLTYVLGSLLFAISCGRNLHYRLLEQLKDIIPYFILSFIACTPAYLINFTSVNLVIKMALQIVSAVAVYCGISYLFKIESLFYVIKTIKSYIPKKRMERKQ